MALRSFCVLILCWVASMTHAVDLPKSWKTCRRSDVNRDTCLKEAAQTALSSLFNGERTLGLAPLDPLFIPQTVISNNKGNVKAEMYLTNYTVSGYKTARFDSFKFDCNKLHLATNVTMQGDVVVFGNYNIVGKFLVLPVSGKGKVKISIKGLKLFVKLTMSTMKKAGVSHFRIESSSFNLNVEKVVLRFGNLFNGNKQLGDRTNKALNENWKTLFEELKPSVERELGKIMSEYPKVVFNRIPSSELCPN